MIKLEDVKPCDVVWSGDDQYRIAAVDRSFNTLLVEMVNQRNEVQGPKLSVSSTKFLRTARKEKVPKPEPLKVGDVVRLKCGGPAMVITSVWENGEGKPKVPDDIMTIWHKEDGTVCERQFPRVSLAPADALTWGDET